jgi:arylsulfatase A-like enzyme
VLMVIIDTLRADKLGCYGNQRDLTPNLDRLAAEGILFEQASAHAPWTLPSTASLFTSLYPRQHGAGGHSLQFTRLAPSVPTAAGIFEEAGYDTAAIVNVDFLGRRFGLDLGFDHFDAVVSHDNHQLRNAEATTDAALEWLATTGERPFFLLVHYFDTHAVYDPPQPYRRRFAEAEDRESDWVFGSREDMLALRAGRLELDVEVMRRAEALYDGEIAYTDEHVGRLLDEIDAAGLGNDLCVVFTSDHGEEWLDHGDFEHGHTLYEELLHIPLLLRLPGRREAMRIPQSVRHVDVLPTLCAITGTRPRENFEGTSLLPLIRGVETEHRPVLAHGNFWSEPLTSFRDERNKVIVKPGKGEEPLSVEFYRWREDPAERDDLAGERSEEVEATRAALVRIEKSLRAHVLTDPQRVYLPPEVQRQLESLGYGGSLRDD